MIKQNKMHNCSNYHNYILKNKLHNLKTGNYEISQYSV